jgi:hypothetical protein
MIYHGVKMETKLFTILLFSLIIGFPFNGLQNIYSQNIEDKELKDNISDITVTDMDNNEVSL